MRPSRRGATSATLLTTVLLLAACSPGGGTPSPTSAPPSGTTLPTATETPAPAPDPTTDAPDPLAGWSLEQKVGQLLMVGVDVGKIDQASYDAVHQHHVGNVFLAGRTQAGVAPVKNLVDSFTALVTDETTHGTPMLVATDQEGGRVQVLRGPGFSDVPSAMEQSALAPADLQGQATTWGRELADAGIGLNLAPVMDVVTSPGTAATNAPIGYFERNYGFEVESVTSHANAFSAGMEASGVDVAIKHFPGLGRVGGNTDTTADVRDTVTTRDDPSVAAFRSGIEAGAAFVMTSTAIYDQIDGSLPAAFSPVVVDGLLRGDLGFGGVVVTDDVSAAEQVQAWSPGERAVLTIAAGGDLVLASADPTVIPQMATALVERAQADPAFAGKVDAAVLRVLAAKERLGS
ncbi:glycoside hydrolase family 3 protein [Oerskovia turbata]|uniref:beta-N-acetylhexosaminidase n=1 Tax=Oerskovia turbata TaxID=1713 RepID=A0A4Q1KPW7_9CELL|nr:glycoside hydrolase family 3 N-terminal domain-containing protein [Oerskovia turbata]RXR22705.1 glycoside hydrolase family 3 protein [Oerskovia turbata]RXR32041.1 glycoside hydrolase family 3 protein [Oerskovia turbata]TGJ96074.1 glycoside hydrolase family 3 protein [Actinotalea fermentans ATCC 43279 = JCM 9966 = DSM 3133]